MHVRRAFSAKVLRSVSALAAVMVCAATPLSAAWRPTGPFGGDAELVRIVPKVKDLVVAGTHNGLIFRSTNGGAYWTSVNFPPQFAGTLHALEIDPQVETTWYAGMESETQWLAGVWKTTDSGRSWTLLPETKGISVWSLAIWSGDSKVIAAGTGAGVLRSMDRGASWKRVSPSENTELKPVVSLAFNPTDNKILYAGTTHLPWRTLDSGATWKSIHEGMLDDSDVFSIQVDAAKPTRIFASACSGVYTSGDEGGKWNKLNTPKGAFRTYFVAIEPKHSDTIFAGTTEGLLRSADGGHNWRVVSPQAVRSMAFDAWVPGRLFFASSTAGLLVSTDDGLTVKDSNFGFTNRNFTTLTGAGEQLYSSSVYEPVSGGIYRTGNLGLRWIHSGEPRPDQLLVMAASPDNPEKLLAAGYRGLLQSTDGGKTWAPAPGPSGAKIAGISALPHGITVVATEQGLFRSVSSGSWVQTSPAAVTTLGVSGGMPFALAATAAFVSPDQGLTWRECGNPLTAVTWYGLAFDSGSPSTALAATSAGPYRSTDGCKTWTPLREGLRAETASLVLFHPTRRGEAYISQGGQVFRSIDGGQRWSPLDDDSQTADSRSSLGPSSLYVLPSAPDRLFALFPRRGVFSTTIVTKEKTLQ
ncbi:MAG TPA: hypothetical protein VNH18_20275 [Bryobacteraceae bacterium]|nr:hypothetical protein [Bryobacteraceae bacterium]